VKHFTARKTGERLSLRQLVQGARRKREVPPGDIGGVLNEEGAWGLGIGFQSQGVLHVSLAFVACFLFRPPLHNGCTNSCKSGRGGRIRTGDALRPSLAEVRAGSRPTNVYWG
jgi:hypothetical protein